MKRFSPPRARIVPISPVRSMMLMMSVLVKMKLTDEEYQGRGEPDEALEGGGDAREEPRRLVPAGQLDRHPFAATAGHDRGRGRHGPSASRLSSCSRRGSPT